MRRRVKVKAPRSPRQRKPTGDGKPRVYVPYLNNRVGCLLQEGPEQSLVWFFDDRSDEFLRQEMIMSNEHFIRGSPRVRIKGERVRLKRKFRPGRSTRNLSSTRFDTMEDEL